VTQVVRLATTARFASWRTVDLAAQPQQGTSSLEVSEDDDLFVVEGGQIHASTEAQQQVFAW